MEHKVGDIWYRYEEKSFSVIIDADREEYGVRHEVHRLPYWVVRLTPKGVWLTPKYGDKCPIWPKKGELHFAPRLVLHASRKRFACATDELAKESFIKRKEKQKAIYEARAKMAQKAIDAVTGEKPSIFGGLRLVLR